tara:strand:- start:92 stop:457 length:366 start_codon:yes stop_codon:yes gene_type:complete
MQLNGFVLNTHIDHVDELFDEGIVRYFVNHVLYELDFQRQIHFEEQLKKPDSRPIPDGHANQASIEEHKVYCEVVLQDPSKPDWWEPDTKGIAWNIHQQGKMNLKEIDNIRYDIYSIEDKK